MRVGLGRGRQERTFQVEGTACAMTCVREESKMESSGKKERDSSGACTSLELQSLLLHPTVFWNLVGHEVSF